MRRLSILGSTGTIGRATLAVVRRHPEEFGVAALAAGGNLTVLADQADEFKPDFISVSRKEDAETLRRHFKDGPVKIGWGEDAAVEAASHHAADIVVSAITGVAGLRPTLAAVLAGKKVALANKESMVVAGPLLVREAARTGASLIPVDSEHSGVFQCLEGRDRSQVRRVVLTASGGPFLKTPLARMRSASIKEALDHPRWKMGRKVTIDSATMMNKGLELIEARWLFGLDPACLDVLIHPQSIVHALVELRDGSVLAQLSPTDMRFPIQYALTHPDRLDAPRAPLDLAAAEGLEFAAVDPRRFPLLGLARTVLAAGDDSAAVALNAANEEAVAAFLAGRFPFGGIAGVVNAAMARHRPSETPDLEALFEIDREARLAARQIVEQRT